MTMSLDDVAAQLNAAMDANPAARQAIAEFMGNAGGDLSALMLRAQASKAIGDAAKLLDEADRVEQRAALAKVVSDAEDTLRVVQAEADRLSDAVRGAVEAERVAADKYTAAAEFAQQARERAEDLALAEAEPSPQADSIVRRDAAEQVARRFQVSAERATAERVRAEGSSATAREAVRQAKTALKAAKVAADNPPFPEPSWFTCHFDGIRRLSAGKNLGSAGIAEVTAMVENLSVILGLDKIFAARERKRLEEALKRAPQPPQKASDQNQRPESQIITPPGTAPIAPPLAALLAPIR